MRSIILGVAMVLSTMSIAQTTLVENSISFEQVKMLKEKNEAKELIKEGITQYTASNGVLVKIGDKLRLNRPEGGSRTFVSIQKKPTVMDFFGSGGYYSSVNTSMSNTEITTKAFFIVGSKKIGFKTMAELATCGTCNNLIVDIELAFEAKEVKTNQMSREEAIAKLKETKDLLDLGLITQEDYDKLKFELTPIIIHK